MKIMNLLMLNVIETIVDKNKINFTFKFKESEKFYVERINIFGNNITQENFIRHQLDCG